MRTTYVSFVLDSSGSMGHLVNDVHKTFEELLRPLRDDQEDVRVSAYQFNTVVNRLEFLRDPHSLRTIRASASGMAALYDAVDRAVTDLKELHDTRFDSAYLLVVLTDGQENASKINHVGFGSLIRNLERDPKWTVTFQLPPGTADVFVRLSGVSRDNCREWEATSRGYQETTYATTVGLHDYMADRKLGVTKTSNFYKATTDLSQLTQKDLRRLDDLSDRFQTLEVTREEEIKPFIERLTGKTYLSGTAYYQLTKPETIQATKQVLVKEKTGRKLYGGPQARVLVGLHDYQDGKVSPGNHANFDIFVQSTSVNRKLVRGTRVMVVK